jgi:hypothetical protein
MRLQERYLVQANLGGYATQIKNWSFCSVYRCIRGFGAKKYNSAQNKYTNEQWQTKKTFAPVICVFAYLCIH